MAHVQIRGVNVGSVSSVRPSLAQVDVLVDIKDASTVIPRNSIIEANQSGLIATPIIDITPQLPIPDYKARPYFLLTKSPASCFVSPGATVPAVKLPVVSTTLVNRLYMPPFMSQFHKYPWLPRDGH